MLRLLKFSQFSQLQFIRGNWKWWLCPSSGWLLEGWKRLESAPIQLTSKNGGVLELMGGVNSKGNYLKVDYERISAYVSSVFPFSNVFTKNFPFSLLLIRGGVIVSNISSNLVCSVELIPICISEQCRWSEGPEQTALIPPFMSDKTGFAMIDRSGSSFLVNPEPFFFESVMLLYFVCDLLWSISKGTRSP